ncbi:MAG TPA: MFS transporter [Thermomicrobiales bacterium]|nr:MFS transporter [Thermomicrobiales bacterium]
MRVRRTGLWLHRDFLRFWAAQSVSQVGTQVSMLALPLIAALTLDASPFEVGVLAAAGQAPMLLVGLFAGAWVDRRHRRPVMMLADLGRAGVLLAIPIAAALDLLGMGLLYVVAFVAGTLTVFFDVSYLSYVPTLVGRNGLVEANGKLEATASVAQVTGPGLGGLLVALLTAPFAILVDAASFLVSALFLSRIRTTEPPPAPAHERPGVLHEIREGLRHVGHEPILRSLVGCSAVTNLFGYAFLAVYVLYMAQELGLGSAAIGLVFATGGVGAFVGAMLAGPVARRFGTGWTLIGAQFGFGFTGMFVPLAVLVPRFALPCVVASEFLQWLMFLIYVVNAISLRQRLTDHRIQGRVNATFTTVARGMQPLGSLLGGWLGSRIGLPWTLVAGEAGMFVAFAWLLASPLRRRGDVVSVIEPVEEAVGIAA